MKDIITSTSLVIAERIITNAIYSRPVMEREGYSLVRMQGKMLEAIAKALGRTVEDYEVRSKKREYTELRFIAAKIMRHYFPKITLREIGAHFNQDFDHTSVINMLDQANNLLEGNDEAFTLKYRKATTAIYKWITEYK